MRNLIAVGVAALLVAACGSQHSVEGNNSADSNSSANVVAEENASNAQ